LKSDPKAVPPLKNASENESRNGGMPAIVEHQVAVEIKKVPAPFDKG
jgi:hypothetical protein